MTYNDESANAKAEIVLPLNKLILRVKNEPKLPMVWSGIKENSFGLIVGPSKSCKTTLCENLGMSIAAGAPEFLGMPINVSNRRVLFISCEEFYSNRTERNEKQSNKLIAMYGDEWIENYLVVNEHVPRYVSTQTEWKIIYDMIAEAKPGVVIIDSLSRLYQGSIEDSKVAKDLTERLRELSNSLKITLLVIHHTYKLESSQALSIHTIAGSRILSQEADFMIGMNKTLDNIGYIKSIAFRYADDNADKVQVFKLDDHLWVNVIKEEYESKLLTAFDGRKNSTNTDKLLDFIAEKTTSVGYATFNDISTELIRSKVMGKQTVYNQLPKMIADGSVEKLGSGRYKYIKSGSEENDKAA